MVTQLEGFHSVKCWPVRKDGIPDAAQTPNLFKRVRVGITLRLELSTGPQIFTRNLPYKNAIVQRRNQIGRDFLFLFLPQIMSVEEDVRVNRVHASGLC